MGAGRQLFSAPAHWPQLLGLLPEADLPPDSLTFTFCWAVLLLLFVSESLGTLLIFYCYKLSYFK